MEIREIIRQLHVQWKQAKAHLAERCAAIGNSEMADKLAACDMFKGTEDLAAIAELFSSPQGIEFCIAAKFPSLATLRMFKSLDIEQFGIFIDAGNITLNNPVKAVLIGRTTARVNYTHNTQLHHLTLLRGASAVINAAGWAVVGVNTERGCNVIKNITGNAVLLC